MVLGREKQRVWCREREGCGFEERETDIERFKNREMGITLFLMPDTEPSLSGGGHEEILQP